jgi:hypothetical protein
MDVVIVHRFEQAFPTSSIDGTRSRTPLRNSSEAGRWSCIRWDLFPALANLLSFTVTRGHYLDMDPSVILQRSSMPACPRALSRGSAGGHTQWFR